MALIVEVRINEEPNLFVISMQNIGTLPAKSCVYEVIMWRDGKQERSFTVEHSRADGAEILVAKSLLAYKEIVDAR